MVLKDIWKKYGVLWAGLFVGQMMVMGLGVVWPLVIKFFLDRLENREFLGAAWPLALGMLAALWARVWIQARVKSVNYALAWEIADDLRHRMYRHLQQLALTRIKKIEQTEILAKSSLDLENVRRFMAMEALEGVGSLLSIVILAGIMLALNVYLAMSVLVMVPWVIWFCKRLIPALTMGFQQTQKGSEGLLRMMGELIQAMGLIRALGLEPYFQKRFEALQQQQSRFSQSNHKLMLSLSHGMELANGAALVVIFSFGIFLVGVGQLSLGSLIAFYIFWTMFTVPILRLGNLQSAFQEALSSLSRIEDLLYLDDKTPQSAADCRRLESLFGSIIFDQVSFSYAPMPPILQGVSWQVQPGRMTALVGSSGGGKSTLVHLILRFFDPQGGRVLIDGHDLRSIDLESYRRQIGVVLQDDFIFSGTVRENLLLDVQCRDSEVKKALNAACALEFVSQLPGGLETKIGERGLQLSVGQRQRLSLARALLRRPKILLLDEATCALDALTENEVQRNVRVHCPEASIIIIAHRFSTIMDVDHIAVLDQGRIIQQGSHIHLLSQEGLYSRLYYEQFR